MKSRAEPRTSVRALLFDFDGVILESLDVKTAAFRRLFRKYPRHVGRIVRHHLRHSGVSRFEKFDFIYRRILRKPLAPSEKRRLGREFAARVFDEIVECPFVPGARELLAERPFPCFVLSATPAPELRRILRARRLTRFFKAVFGFPVGKPEAIRRILHRWNLDPREALYVGDARADWLAARATGVRFLGRVPRGRRSPFPKRVPTVEDLRGVAASLNGPRRNPRSPAGRR